jgi:hypothetical protein
MMARLEDGVWIAEVVTLLSSKGGLLCDRV